MSLNPGTRLGPYEVLGPLGAGGMGEVYRARDTRLDREVALKVLPESFALDAERLARFEREAKTLASLNHPHIAQVHGFEEAGGVRVLAMELVEGDDLSRRIAGGPMDDRQHEQGLGVTEHSLSDPGLPNSGLVAAGCRGTVRIGPVAQPEEREAIVSRVEFDLSYAELADVLGKPSPDAARMTVVRALVRLAQEMNREG